MVKNRCKNNVFGTVGKEDFILQTTNTNNSSTIMGMPERQSYADIQEGQLNPAYFFSSLAFNHPEVLYDKPFKIYGSTICVSGYPGL